MKLSLTVPFHPGQSLTSYASALARRNFRPSAYVFSAEMGLPFSDILDGSDFAIDKLSVLGGVEAPLLRSSALRRIEGRNFLLSNETVRASSLKRRAIVVCPHCLGEDQTDGRFGSELDMYGRAVWEVRHIRTCARHSVALVDLNVPSTRRLEYDFSYHIFGRRQQLSELATTARRRSASHFEEYLTMRLSGMHSDVQWLNSLTFSVAAKACEIFGAVAAFGRTPNLKQFSDDDWATAGAAGFEVLQRGPSRIRDFLDSLCTNDILTKREGPHNWFGRIYEWLSQSKREADVEPVRQVVRDYIIDNTALPDGAEILGGHLEHRKVHSVLSASRHYGVHTQTTRKLMAAASLIPADHVNFADNQLTVPAAAADQLLTALRNGIPPKGIGSYLSIPRCQVAWLRSAFLKPVLDVPGMEVLYSKSDLDTFLDHIFEDAVATPLHEPGHVSLSEAARKAHCSINEIVGLILTKRLTWVGRDPMTQKRFSNILVNLAEVKARTQMPPLDGDTIGTFAGVFGITVRAATLLSESGHIATALRINPSNRCPVRIVSQQTQQELQGRYISLRDLARKQAIASKTLHRILREKGVEPVADWSKAGATVFLRSDI